jgi:hypothetical protein
MDVIERVAHVSVGRACGFCGLAIICFMVGFSYEPYLSARAGGLFSFALTLVLVFKGMRAMRQPYKSTETWLMLTEAERPPAAVAQAVIGAVLRGVFFQYARYCAAVTVVLLSAATLLAMTAA